MNSNSWTDGRYEPESLEEFALEEAAREEIEAWLEHPGHLLLDGPPGTGKTTLAYWLASEVGAETRGLDASQYGGVDTIRRQVLQWGKRLRDGRAVVVLDEADYLTHRAQGVLRGPMNSVEWDELLVVIATTNEAEEKLDDALQSRFSRGATVRVPYPPLRERQRALARVLDRAGHAPDPGRLREHARAHPDLREMINKAERSVRRHGQLPSYPSAQEMDEKLRKALALLDRLHREKGGWPGYTDATKRWEHSKTTLHDRVDEAVDRGLAEKDPPRLTDQGKEVVSRAST